jgi:hypothetical protein
VVVGKGLDGRALSARATEQLARRRLAEIEEKARRQRDGLDPVRSESLSMTFGALTDWWWELKGTRTCGSRFTLTAASTTATCERGSRVRSEAHRRRSISRSRTG